MLSRIESISREFFTLMGIDLEELTVACQDEKRNIYLVNIKTSDSKLVIGMHGQSLEMIKHLLTRIIERTLETSFIIHVEVNDYLQARDERFFRYLDSRIEYVTRVGGEISLPDLTGFERKKVHGYVSEKGIAGLKSFSVGEGKERTMHLEYLVPLKKVELTIEEDGVGI